MSYHPPTDYQWVYLDIKKDIKVDVKFDIENDYELDVDIKKDVKVDVDIKTDVDLDDNSALLTAVFETVNPEYALLGNGEAYTDDYHSIVTANGTVVNGNYPVSDIDAKAWAYGDKTFAELDFTVEAYDFGSITTIIAESATD